MGPQASRAFEGAFNPLTTPIGGTRADFERMQSRLRSGEVVMTDGSLRLESAALAATSAIEFQVTEKGSANNTVNEVRLAQNDAFLCNRVSVFLAIRLTADAVSSSRPVTFDNSNIFTTAASLNAARGFFNGRVQTRMNSTVLVDSIDMLSFMRADYAQAGQLIFTASNQSTSYWGQDQAFRPLTPNWLFNGTANNTVTVQLPESVTFTLATFTITAVCLLRGWKLQNGGTQRTER